MKKYKLKKDWISAIGEKSSTGELFIRNGKVYRGEQSKQCFIIDAVEHNPEWFEEIKERERIQVTLGATGSRTGWVIKGGRAQYELPMYFYELQSLFQLPEEKYAAIKEAIENVLNEEVDKKIAIFMAPYWKSLGLEYEKFDAKERDKKYTEKDMEDCWKKAMAMSVAQYDPNANRFKDYLKSLNK